MPPIARAIWSSDKLWNLRRFSAPVSPETTTTWWRFRTSNLLFEARGGQFGTMRLHRLVCGVCCRGCFFRPQILGLRFRVTPRVLLPPLSGRRRARAEGTPICRAKFLHPRGRSFGLSTFSWPSSDVTAAPSPPKPSGTAPSETKRRRRYKAPFGLPLRTSTLTKLRRLLFYFSSI